MINNWLGTTVYGVRWAIPAECRAASILSCSISHLWPNPLSFSPVLARSWPLSQRHDFRLVRFCVLQYFFRVLQLLLWRLLMHGLCLFPTPEAISSNLNGLHSCLTWGRVCGRPAVQFLSFSDPAPRRCQHSELFNEKAGYAWTRLAASNYLKSSC